MKKVLKNIARITLLGAAGVGVFNGYGHLKSTAKSASSDEAVLKNVSYVSNPDGDTIVVNIDKVPPIFGRNIPVRIAHIDTAEMRWDDECEKNASEVARDELTKLLERAKRIDLINIKRDKYFRILADVIIDDSINVSAQMLSRKMAVPYEGEAKTKVDWCKYPPNKK